MRRMLLVLVCALFLPRLAAAQCASPCSVYAGQKFSVVMDDTSNAVANVDGYRLYNGTAVMVDLTTAAARSGTVVTFPFANGLSVVGTYSINATAYNNFSGESSHSAAVTLVVKTAPPGPLPPTNLRIIVP